MTNYVQMVARISQSDVILIAAEVNAELVGYLSSP